MRSGKESEGQRVKVKKLYFAHSDSLQLFQTMGQYSFTKTERLLKKKDFVSVRKEGERIAGKNFTIFLRKNNLGIRRLGLAVSSKIGNAVKRNRIKRLLREFFRLNKEIFPSSVDIFISVKQGFNPGGYREVKKEFQVLGFETQNF